MPDKQPSRLPPNVPREGVVAAVTPEPGVRYHVMHGLRDIAIVAGIAAVTYISSDDFAKPFKDNPDLLVYILLLQIGARAILVAWGKMAEPK